MDTANQPSLLWPHFQQRVVNAPASSLPPDPAMALWAKKLSMQCDDMKSIFENAIQHISLQQNESQDFLRQATARWDAAVLLREQKMGELDEKLNESVYALRTACNTCYDAIRSTDVKLKLIDSLLTNMQNRMDVQDARLQNIESILLRNAHAHETHTLSSSVTNSNPTNMNDTNAVEIMQVSPPLMQVENLAQPKTSGTVRKKTKRRLVSRGTDDDLYEK